MEEATLIMYLIGITAMVMIQATIIIFGVWMLRKRQVWSLIKFGMRGGTLILKGYPDNTIEILQTKKAIDHIKWDDVDPTTGKKRKLNQQISRVYHTLKGTSYPIHFCPYTYPSNINMLDKEKAQLNTKEINALMVKQYMQGASDASNFKTVGGFPLDKATLILLFIVGALILVLIVMNLQVLEAVNV